MDRKRRRVVCRRWFKKSDEIRVLRGVVYMINSRAVYSPLGAADILFGCFTECQDPSGPIRGPAVF